MRRRITVGVAIAIISVSVSTLGFMVGAWAAAALSDYGYYGPHLSKYYRNFALVDSNGQQDSVLAGSHVQVRFNESAS